MKFAYSAVFCTRVHVCECACRECACVCAFEYTCMFVHVPVRACVCVGSRKCMCMRVLCSGCPDDVIIRNVYTACVHILQERTCISVMHEVTLLWVYQERVAVHSSD